MAIVVLMLPALPTNFLEDQKGSVFLHMASSDESSVRFVMEIPGDQDPSEATSCLTDLGPPAPRSGLRWSLRQAAVAARRLMDEENIETEGKERVMSLRETTTWMWV
ncbi:UNVERIFIED_CONTAM: hypothetical protein Slati_0900200 [Sesamum latifolium]|uniref:Uncharacterized protein n=1 Tax=Sesamum latifolium TaxID=2727402 RepID=A0AAW2XV04_9LAMI